MKTERLLSIVFVLINRRLVQAKELADRFGVSVRTIYRDIEAINAAGIPVVTYQGSGGGIGLMEGYRLDRSVWTEKEMADIFAALHSLSSYGGGHELLMDKISGVVSPAGAAAFRSRAARLVIDLSPWGPSGQLEHHLSGLKRAIEESLAVAFTYVSGEGEETQRCAEPYTLMLKGQAWYLYAWCGLRGDFRLFKLGRMKDLRITDRRFERLDIDIADPPWSQNWSDGGGGTSIRLRFHPGGRRLAEEHFSIDELDYSEDGGCYVSIRVPENDWIYGFLLGFGPALEVLEPAHVRSRLAAMAAAVAGQYGYSFGEPDKKTSS